MGVIGFIAGWLILALGIAGFWLAIRQKAPFDGEKRKSGFKGGAVAVVLGILLVGAFAPAKKPETPAPPAAAAAPARPQPAPKPAEKPGFDLARAKTIVRQENPNAAAFLFEKAGTEIEIKKNAGDEGNLDIWIASRRDGARAKELAYALSSGILKSLVADGRSPKQEWYSLFVRVKTRDAPKSVTGGDQIVYFGRASYDFNRDRLEWDPAN